MDPVVKQLGDTVEFVSPHRHAYIAHDDIILYLAIPFMPPVNFVA